MKNTTIALAEHWHVRLTGAKSEETKKILSSEAFMQQQKYPLNHA